MGQRELDLGVLQEEEEEEASGVTLIIYTHTLIHSFISPVSKPPDYKMEAGNLEEESGFYSGGFMIWIGRTWRQTRERPADDITRRWAETHVELLDGRSATLVGGDDLHLHDLDGVGTSAMASSHVTVWKRHRYTSRVLQCLVLKRTTRLSELQLIHYGPIIY